MAHVTPRKLLAYSEATFATPPADWADGPVLFWALEPSVDGVGQQTVDNENYQLSILDTHAKVLGLKHGEFSFGCSWTGAGVNADADDAPVATQVTTNLKASLGGQKLCKASACVSNSTTALTLASGDGANHGKGDWIFLEDVSEGVGYFHRIVSIADDVVTLDRAPAFTVGGADLAHAVIANFPYGPALTDHTHADYITQSFLALGEHAEDRFEVSGVKTAVEITGIESGGSPRLNFTGQATTFRIEDAPNPTITGTPVGEAQLVVGRDRSYVYAGAVDGAMTDQGCVFVCEPTVGIAWERVPSIGGIEGVCGYMATGFNDIGVKFTFPFDNSFHSAYRARTPRQVLVQIGTSKTKAVGLYFPHLVPSAEPKRVDSTGLTSSEVVYQALLSQQDPGSLTGLELGHWTAPMVMLTVA